MWKDLLWDGSTDGASLDVKTRWCCTTRLSIKAWNWAALILFGTQDSKIACSRISLCMSEVFKEWRSMQASYQCDQGYHNMGRWHGSLWRRRMISLSGYSPSVGGDIAVILGIWSGRWGTLNDYLILGGSSWWLWGRGTLNSYPRSARSRWGVISLNGNDVNMGIRGLDTSYQGVKVVNVVGVIIINLMRWWDFILSMLRERGSNTFEVCNLNYQA